MAHRAEWHTPEHDNAWERVKAAFKNDWEQTRHDFGSDRARDLDQDVDDTVKQAAGTGDRFENREQAFRFGYAARREFGDSHDRWDDELDQQLSADYPGDYRKDRPYIQYAYEYRGAPQVRDTSRTGAGLRS